MNINGNINVNGLTAAYQAIVPTGAKVEGTNETKLNGVESLIDTYKQFVKFNGDEEKSVASALGSMGVLQMQGSQKVYQQAQERLKEAKSAWTNVNTLGREPRSERFLLSYYSMFMQGVIAASSLAEQLDSKACSDVQKQAAQLLVDFYSDSATYSTFRGYITPSHLAEDLRATYDTMLEAFKTHGAATVPSEDTSPPNIWLKISGLPTTP